MFIINSILLGIGLAMDAFSVSVVDGLNDIYMRKRKMCCIAGTFAFFQAMMPMIGWTCVHTILQYFKIFERYIPWIALILLILIGGNMILEGLKNKEEEIECFSLGIKGLIIQGIATSIDALSVGFTIADYGLSMAIVCAMLIATVTFIICMLGLRIGKKVGTRFSDKANILGGVILVIIGIEIILGRIF